jgi:hypothetical protein
VAIAGSAGQIPLCCPGGLLRITAGEYTVTGQSNTEQEQRTCVFERQDL